MRSHESNQEGRVVIRRETTIFEQKRLRRIIRIPFHNFGRKEDRRSSARAHELPKRNLRVAVGSIGRVVLRVGIRADGPWRVSGDVASNHEQQTLELVGTERRVCTKNFLQLLRERLTLVEMFQSLQNESLLKHRWSNF